MKQLIDNIKNCQRCELYKTATNKVIGRGSGNPKYLIIGEAPGRLEDETKVPFCGPSGQLLDKWIDYLGIKADEYAIINCLKCRPPDNANPTREQLDACNEWLERQIDLLNPEYIFLLGNFAAKRVGKFKEGITSISGKLYEQEGRKFIPLFHPSYILRGNRDWKPTMKKVKKIIEEPVSTVEKPEKVQNYVPLHLHTIYSDQDSVLRIDKLVDYASENGFEGLAITDHGTISGWWEFQTRCNEKGIHPILGVEFYVAPPESEEQKNKRYHLVAYAKNQEGIRNIFKLVDYSVRDGFYRKPRITMEKLFEFKEGLVVTTACTIGVVALRLVNNQQDEAINVLYDLKTNFGEDFYLELQPHLFDEQQKVNPMLVKLANKYNIKTIITTDAHYLLQENVKIHKALKAIVYNQSLDEAGFSIDTNYVMLDNDLIKHGIDIDIPEEIIKESMKNTFEIMEKCNGKLIPYDDALPKYEVDEWEGFETEVIG